jgi:hypothetical protein
MSITYAGVPILRTETALTSIDSTLLSPTLGTNVRLSLSTDTTVYFVGVVTKLNASVVNATAGIYTGVVLEGVDNTGVKKTIILTSDSLVNNNYDSYDQLFWTNNLDAATPVIDEESATSLVKDTASIQVFDTSNVVVGALITYKKADGTRVDGIVAQVPPTGVQITVATIANGKPANVVLTLIDATSANFEGEIIELGYSA